MSAGLLMYSIVVEPKVFLVLPGGPFKGHEWGIPKGRVNEGETLLVGAIREFEEETGIEVDLNRLTFSGTVRLKRKLLKFWGYRGTGKEQFVKSNKFTMEYPKGSGEMREFPEIIEGRWFILSEARKAIVENQLPILDKFQAYLNDLNEG